MSKKWIALGIIAGVLALAGLGWYFFYSQGVPGFWALDSEASAFYFSSTKNGDIEERHTFHNLDGNADFTGDFLIRIDLASVDTGVEIRDERMRDILFETAKYPVARIEGKFALGDLAEVAVGETVKRTFAVTLSLHGVEKEMDIAVNFERMKWDRVKITPAGGIVIQAGDFNLESGLETLRGIVGLESISPRVPIDFTLVFDGDAKNIRID